MLKRLFLTAKEMVVTMIITFIVIFLFALVVRVGYIPSDSMFPTLHVGDRVAGITTNIVEPEHGDIVVFEPNKDEKEEENELWVKRLIGKPGDKVEIKHGKVYVNGNLLDEPYVKQDMDYTCTFVVPEERYFLLGDNRANSEDSRFWENPFIHLEQARYVVKVNLFPRLVFYK